MKKSAIRGIFNGNRGHMETMSNAIACQELTNELCDSYDKLLAALSPDVLKIHDKYRAALESLHVEDIDFYFAEGFKLGLLVGIECMED